MRTADRHAPATAVTGATLPRSRPGSRRAAATIVCGALAAATGAALLAGCGAKFDLPTENRANRTIPSDRSYQMEATWYGMDDIHDILLTDAGELLMLFNHGGTGIAPRGEVSAYARLTRTGTPQPLPNFPFRTLFNPWALCANRSAVFVLDRGDTCIARTNPATGQCGADDTWNNDVQDLAHYWRVREFNLVGTGGTGKGGIAFDTASTFTDTSVASVEGIAVDDRGQVYVSGTAIVYVPDQIAPNIMARTFLRRVYRYIRGPRYPGVVPADPNMPGAAWHRDTTWMVENGDGGGYVGDPRGIQWRQANGTRALYVADVAKNQAQKLYDDLSSTPYFGIDSDDEGLRMSAPTDIAADELGAVYVADTGNSRVLRYGSDGSFIQRVDVERDARGQALVEPVTVTADSSLVFVGDRTLREVIRYRRRQ